MPKYLIKLGVSHSLESTLVNDLNALSQVVYSAGGSVTNLNVKSRARQICVHIEAQASVIQSLLETKAINTEVIRSIFLVEQEDSGRAKRIAEELCFAGFFHGRNYSDAQAVQVYP